MEKLKDINGVDGYVACPPYLDVLYPNARPVHATRDVIWTPEIALSAWCRRSELSIVCETISS